MKALENRRDDRYQGMKEMLVDLRRLNRQLEREAEIERSVTPEVAAPATGAQALASDPRCAGAQAAVSAAEVVPAP